jgi:lipoprotein-anchoring transpeptidase ErfK/SrfK
MTHRPVTWGWPAMIELRHTVPYTSGRRLLGVLRGSMFRRGRHEHPTLGHLASALVALLLIFGVALGTGAYAVTAADAQSVARIPMRSASVHPDVGGFGPERRAAVRAQVLAELQEALEPETRATQTLAEISFQAEREAALAVAGPHHVVSPRHVADLPPPPADSGSGRRVVYSNSAQRVWLIGDGNQVLDSYRVSGRRGTPAPGTYQVFSRSEVAWADHDGITMRYMVRFARGQTLAIGFHSIPVYPSGRPLQTEEDLGDFRSAGCVRQSLIDARRMWAFAPIGTAVVVTP